MILNKLFFTLRLARLAIYHVLGGQLSDLKFPAQLEITVLSPHTSVEQLVKVDVSVIRTYSHFQHHFPNVIVGHLLR